MVTKLLMVHMMIYLTLGTTLKGRTAQNALESPVSEEGAERVTGPVYSTKPTVSTERAYTKYLVSEAQFKEVNDWFFSENITSFEDCAAVSAYYGDGMFMWADDKCKCSQHVYTRLPEPSDDETATAVYMTDIPDGVHCEGELSTLLEGNLYIGSICGVESIGIFCYRGEFFGINMPEGKLLYDDGEGCFTIKPTDEKMSHSDQSSICYGESTCSPKNESTRATYVQLLKELAGLTATIFKYERFMIDLKYESGSWKWNSGVEQPPDSAGEWASSHPTDSTTKLYGYATASGLESHDENGAAFGCCYRPY